MRTAADLPDAVRQLAVDGREAWNTQDYERARALFEDVLRISKISGDRFGEMTAYHFLGNIAFNECRDEESRVLHTAALEISRTDGDEQGIATSLGSIAHVDMAEGNFRAARRNYDAAVAVYTCAGMTDAAESLRRRSSDLLEGRVQIDAVIHRVKQ